MSRGPLSKYKELVTTGAIDADRGQLRAARSLQILGDKLVRYRPKIMPHLLPFFVNSKKRTVPKGLYLFGGVGRGKTMLMDLFFDEVEFAPKQRLHFHEFMAETHELIAAARKSHEGDPIPRVAKDIAARAQLLCFDELDVRDITDAMILGRLFEALFARDVVVVATSNAAPSDLYKDGLNRDLFLPFVDLIRRHLDVMEIASKKDFRLDKFKGQELYFCPISDESRQAMNDIWLRITGLRRGQEACLPLKGRYLMIPQTCLGAARFSFSDLCSKPHGPGDYVRIAHAFHTVFVDDIPVFGPENPDEARRFITLIDSLYDNGVRLVASAEKEPRLLYSAGDNAALFERTASRLMEMRSEAYVAGKQSSLG